VVEDCDCLVACPSGPISTSPTATTLVVELDDDDVVPHLKPHDNEPSFLTGDRPGPGTGRG